MHGRALTMPDLSECRSAAECLDLVRGEAAHLDREDPSRTRWLVAHSARVEAWTDPRWPTRGQLDAIAGLRPAVLMSFDYHAVLASTSVFRIVGINDGDPDPDGGVIVRDGSGMVTGLLLESAAFRVRRAIPELTEPEREKCVRSGLADLAKHGFTEVHDLLAPAWLGPVLASLADRGELTQRVRVYVPLDELDQAVAAARSWAREGQVELAGAKVFADGTLNSRTAWMLRPFANPLAGHPCGTPLMSVAQLGEAMARTAGLGLEMAVHAIGDGAVRAVLDAAAGLRGSTKPKIRIEHAEIIDRQDVPRFAELGVVCSVQPCHLLADVEVLRRELPDRLDRVLPLRELVHAGCEPGRTLIFGSDVPIVRPHPQDSIHAAVHRARPGDTRPIAPEHALSEREAWACFGG